VSPGVVTFAAPAGTTCDGAITITNPSGQAASLAFNPRPLVSTTSANSATPSGGSSLILWGSSFFTGTIVTVGGASAMIVSQSDSSLGIVVPPGVTGPTTISVTSPTGCSTTVPFTYE